MSALCQPLLVIGGMGDLDLPSFPRSSEASGCPASYSSSVPSPMPTSCAILGKSLNASEPQFSLLGNGVVTLTQQSSVRFNRVRVTGSLSQRHSAGFMVRVTRGRATIEELEAP